MSRNYDNWERLVAAVLKREQIWQLCHQDSISSSIFSDDSSDLGLSLRFSDVPFSLGSLRIDRTFELGPQLEEGDFGSTSYKVVLQLEIHDDKDKQKAMKAVSTLSGLESLAMDMKEKKLTVVGDVDPVEVVSKLRKSWHPHILTVGPAKEPEKKEGEKKEEKKDEKKVEKKDEKRVNK